MCRVYVLYDVRKPHLYRYVGKTVGTLSRRLARHKTTVPSLPHLHVCRWMAKAGLHNVRIMAIAEVPECELANAERMWIATLEAAGYPLTNTAPGGQSSGFPKGYWHHTPESLAKMVEGRRKRNNGGYGACGPHTPEHGATISAGLKRYHDKRRIAN